MAKDKAKQDVGSSLLDFEELSELSFTSVKTVPPSEAATVSADTAPPAEPVGEATAAATPVAPPPSRTAPAVRKTQKTVAKAKKDNFARYAALFALLGFILIFAGVLYVRSDSNKLGQAYVILPPAVVNLGGQVVRMQVTLQARREDEGWLLDNQKALAEIFRIEASRIDGDDLHTEQGMAAVQDNFKTKMNESLKVDKIQSVLLTELLVQNRE